MAKIFDQFTNQYSLSKTLRFELKPVGKTLDNMRNHQTFLKDQQIENAYQTLKPVFDFLHEEFITESLESETAQKMDFTEYYSCYKTKEDLQKVEKSLRNIFSEIFIRTANKWKEKIGKNEKGKAILSAKSYEILTEKGILDYLSKYIENFSSIAPIEDIEKALKIFQDGFFTYFSGFNQNRENYYETKKEASTAIATRIVHENLPKFCDNILFFESRSKEYLEAYNMLKNLGRDLINKSGQALYPINKDIFQIAYFPFCFSQKQIEKYNQEIGNANFIVNLYNQTKKSEKDFKKIPLFKTLYKQIGCGKRKGVIFAITDDRKVDAEKKRENGQEAISIEEVLTLGRTAGAQYFQGKGTNGIIDTVPEFIDYLKSRENYIGIYWSKVAMNTLSNKYFANWHELKDQLKKAKIFEKVKKGSEDDVKIPDVIELEGLFKVLDESENWKKNFFKESLLKDEKKKNIIEQSATPSRALISMLAHDMEECAQKFLDQSKKIQAFNEYKSKLSKEEIKEWLENALTVLQMMKYFAVKENKIKGNSLDSEISNALKNILAEAKFMYDGEQIEVKWFQWYDALRNYLTKKNSESVKENKLKLNFENSTLAAGWDVNKEASNYCIVLEDEQGKKFLAIIAKQEKQKGFNKIFEKNENNPLYKINSGEVYRKMEYDFWSDVSKMIPKCSTQLKDPHGLPVWVGPVQVPGLKVSIADEASGMLVFVDSDAARAMSKLPGRWVAAEGYVDGPQQVVVLHWRELSD